jgi:hypothetical protein
MRAVIVFLNRFVEQLSSKARPSFEEIDYAPTQVVTECQLAPWTAERKSHSDVRHLRGRAQPARPTAPGC